ncbi:ribosome biogenesis GTP-binding protein YihA/YsxC [Amedibacterium intestinale]|jgi:ribosome biogenesis GTP-binding protein ysxC|uniref:ribosome biogenesis GTP-binding protein YihA/YsxC n=1 Tax=Amedibacterium intestinale TaxID=2583452 RepID=UPI000E208C91|nr:ribosome biogenesis GTP-binding protein YihA/YsxC [Amedibacterium intestinale]RHO33789.1 YihA family ribosome biogenesis GTP-binding protein [Erysipelotrichaceae bacterium AM17-60]
MISFQKAELVISAPDKKSWPDTDLPEVVLAGRSNVGKSSFINTMCGRKKLAYVGNSPGKTRLLNFFNLDDKYMFVDVPGYGYAKISKTQLLKFGQMMEDYFSQRKQKKGMVLLVDARHKPTEDDITMMEFARYYEIPICVVATKMDKVKPSQKHKQLKEIRRVLDMREDEPLFPFSSERKEGMEPIWDYLIPIFES